MSVHIRQQFWVLIFHLRSRRDKIRIEMRAPIDRRNFSSCQINTQHVCHTQTHSRPSNALSISLMIPNVHIYLFSNNWTGNRTARGMFNEWTYVACDLFNLLLINISQWMKKMPPKFPAFSIYRTQLYFPKSFTPLESLLDHRLDQWRRFDYKFHENHCDVHHYDRFVWFITCAFFSSYIEFYKFQRISETSSSNASKRMSLHKIVMMRINVWFGLLLNHHYNGHREWQHWNNTFNAFPRSINFLVSMGVLCVASRGARLIIWVKSILNAYDKCGRVDVCRMIEKNTKSVVIGVHSFRANLQIACVGCDLDRSFLRKYDLNLSVLWSYCNMLQKTQWFYVSVGKGIFEVANYVVTSFQRRRSSKAALFSSPDAMICSACVPALDAIQQSLQALTLCCATHSSFKIRTVHIHTHMLIIIVYEHTIELWHNPKTRIKCF